MNGNGVCLIIPGHTEPKGRARSVRLPNGHIRHYTPEKTKRWENDVRWIARAVMEDRKPFTGPVVLIVKVWRAVPRSWPQWKKDAALNNEITPDSKPDLDNQIKAVKDALNGIIWQDDAQVAYIIAEKRYSNKPQAEITVQPMETHSSRITRRGQLEQQEAAG